MTSSSPTATATVFVDADNTLWDTDSVYAAAQLRMLEAIETVTGTYAQSLDRLGYIRAFDQAIAERHHAGLRYPPRLLAHAVALGLKGEPVASAARRALKDLDHGGGLEGTAADAAIGRFFAALKSLPPLRPGVGPGLKQLKAMGCLVIIVTEGAQARISATVNALKLTAWIDRVIEAPKQTRLYTRVARLSHAPLPMFMVGDQLQRDIAPAKAAGLETIYFPGDFAPKWEPREEVVGPDHRIDTFTQVAQIVADHLKTPAPSAALRRAQITRTEFLAPARD